MQFQIGQTYSRQEISNALGGSIRSFLPTVKGEVVCGCFRPDKKWNPDAPETVVYGPRPLVQKAAEKIAEQQSAIPVFKRVAAKKWKYLGDYVCVGHDTDHGTCRRSEKQNPVRGPIAGVLKFEPVNKAA